MSKEKEHNLFKLIKSLNKSEKRNFKLFAQRSFSSKRDLQFVEVFNVYNASKYYDKKKLERTLSHFSKHQYSDLKSHLHKQILLSLRLLYSKEDEFKIREGIDFANILYRKGHFLQSLDQLAKTKSKAIESENYSLLHEILETEKKIESRHVTRSHSNRAEELTGQIIDTRRKLFSSTSWSDLSLTLYSKYLQIGHVKNVNEYEDTQRYFELNVPKSRPSDDDSFFISLHKIRSHVWYYYILQDFKSGYKYGLKYVQLFDRFPEFKRREKLEYIKALHNCLAILFYCTDKARHDIYLAKLSLYIDHNENTLSENARQISFVYLETAKLNSIMLSGRFNHSFIYLEELSNQLEEKEFNLDSHRLMIFWYKIATIYFSAGENKQCVFYLNKIINRNELTLREDVQCFARILDLVAHFEMGNSEFLTYKIKSVYRFLSKMKDLQAVQKEFMRFLKASIYMKENQFENALKFLKKNLEEIRKNPFERRPFLYLDILSWLDSKIEKRPVAEMVRRRLKIN